MNGMLPRDSYPLDTRLFRAFVAAAEAQSFSDAARRIYMTQSGVSQHVAKLEEQVGLLLFHRLGKRVVLSDAGKELVLFIKESAGSLTAFLHELRNSFGSDRACAHLIMQPSCWTLPPLKRLFEERVFEGLLRLDVTMASCDELVQALLEKRADFGISGTFDEQDAALVETPLFQEECVLVAPDLGMVDLTNPQSLLSIPFVLFPDADAYLRFWCASHFDDPNFDPSQLHVSGTVNSICAAIDMVLHGVGVSVFPRHCVDRHIARGDLEVFRTRQPVLNMVRILAVPNWAPGTLLRRLFNRLTDCDGDSAAAPSSSGTRFSL